MFHEDVNNVTAAVKIELKVHKRASVLEWKEEGGEGRGVSAQLGA